MYFLFTIVNRFLDVTLSFNVCVVLFVAVSDVMKRSSSNSQPSASQRLSPGRKQQNVTGQMCRYSRMVAAFEQNSENPKTPPPVTGASCRKLKLGCKSTQRGAKLVTDRSSSYPKPLISVTPKPEPTKNVISPQSTSCAETPVNAPCRQSWMSTCNWTPSDASSTQHAVPRPPRATHGQRSSQSSNMSTSVNETNTTRLHSGLDGATDCQSVPTGTAYPINNTNGRRQSSRMKTPSTTGATSSRTDAAGCSNSKPSTLFTSPQLSFVAQQSKRQTSANHKNCSQSGPASEWTARHRAGFLQSGPSASGQTAWRAGNQPSASCSKIKTPANDRNSPADKSTSNYGAYCTKSARLTPATISDQQSARVKTATPANRPSYPESGLNTKPTSKCGDRRSNSRAHVALNPAKSFTGHKTAVIAKPAVYYDNSGQEVNAVSTSKKHISTADIVHSSPAAPHSDAVTRVVSLQPNSGVTKKKKRERERRFIFHNTTKYMYD